MVKLIFMWIVSVYLLDIKKKIYKNMNSFKNNGKPIACFYEKLLYFPQSKCLLRRVFYSFPSLFTVSHHRRQVDPPSHFSCLQSGVIMLCWLKSVKKIQPHTNTFLKREWMLITFSGHYGCYSWHYTETWHMVGPVAAVGSAATSMKRLCWVPLKSTRPFHAVCVWRMESFAHAWFCNTCIVGLLNHAGLPNVGTLLFIIPKKSHLLIPAT